jgi:hypothetical protein
MDWVESPTYIPGADVEGFGGSTDRVIWPITNCW